MDIDIFRYIGNQDPAWDWRSFDLEKDIDRALLHEKDIHVVRPDLAEFKARGQRALQIPALSNRWHSSFQAMLQQDLSSKTVVGNPRLADEEQAPAWPGFRQMRVANINKESDSATSFILSPIDGQPLPLFQAGQFVVLRLLVDPGKPPVLSSYSLSDQPGRRRVPVPLLPPYLLPVTSTIQFLHGYIQFLLATV